MRNKYDDLKLILHDKKIANEEIINCQNKIEALNSKTFDSLQEGFYIYIHLDDFNQVINILISSALRIWLEMLILLI